MGGVVVDWWWWWDLASLSSHVVRMPAAHNFSSHRCIFGCMQAQLRAYHMTRPCRQQAPRLLHERPSGRKPAGNTFFLVRPFHPVPSISPSVLRCGVYLQMNGGMRGIGP